ncbi:MAG: pyrimidine-nucleoside phosphorylase [Miniphocaeibacter sp.]|uniref:pyrimidine-nucleoside phosphorylase n=1 Tax=Miniphocaeibacter sp. TaxID=3100973 RepID=UPI00183F6614|nr:pyrimidine-nucleoside phosphorylase [Gallicola sp.]
MRMYDLILKKRNGNELTDDELDFIINGYTNDEIEDYQISALLMAIYFKGMNERETAKLTMAMASSGDMIDLSSIGGIKVDKHSTGGVGDKTSLIIGPIVAACNVPVAKMSGRGLGHTGGTIDKMESIPGLKTSLDTEEFFSIVNSIGISIIGQTGNIAPADKKLYALRDVTATVDSIPLIASSIMSKKIAAGSDAILLDVKTGSGAFMKTLDDSIELAKEMVNIGVNTGRDTLALITDMDTPLGFAIGNSLEIMEVVNTLKGCGPKDLTEVSLELAANMLVLAKKGTLDECRILAKNVLENGHAFNKLCDMVEAQGGDISVLNDFSLFEKSPIVANLISDRSGIITYIDAESCGLASVSLGAGRTKKGDDIDYSAGIVLKKKIGDKVNKGDILAELYTSKEDSLKDVKKSMLEAFRIEDRDIKVKNHIYARITKDRVYRMYS